MNDGGRVTAGEARLGSVDEICEVNMFDRYEGSEHQQPGGEMSIRTRYERKRELNEQNRDGKRWGEKLSRRNETRRE
jgi:hypothetical protein